MITLDHLSPEHLAELMEGSSITEEAIVARGYRTLYGEEEDREFLRSLGYRPAVVDREETYPALLVPILGADGEPRTYQIKPATPLVKIGAKGTPATLKYVSPPRVPMAVDIPAATLEVLEDPGEALWVTEGMKKTDSLVSRGLPAVGLLGVWNWRSRHGTLGDWEDVPIKGRPVVVCFDADAVDNRHVQQAMARFGAWLKSRGASKVHYLIVPSVVDGTAVKGVDDFFAAGGTLADLHQAATETPPGGDAQDGSFSDAFLVEELVSEALEGNYCWTAGLGWLKWSGRTWQEVSEVGPVEAARVWASGRFDAVLAAQGADAKRDRAKEIAGWRGVLGNSRLRALVSLSRGLIQEEADAFDADPDLLTVRNGTVHLPTGRLLPFDPAHRITKMAGAHYRPGARHPKWDAALAALPEQTRVWYRDRMGQALTGYQTPDHRMLLNYGDGSNGKSTVINTIRTTFGQYGVLISDRVLMAQPDAHPTELMDLRGARLAILEETPEARHLNVQRLKSTVGTPSIKARRIRQDPVEFIATHSLFINTNYRLIVSETDHGTWRRLALVDFPYTFKPAPKPLEGPWDRRGDAAMEYAHNDPDVLSAALAWMVEGAREWYARDRMMLPLPESVEASTRNWRAETDLVMGFWDECLRRDETGFVTSADMLRTFNDWAGDRQHRPWNDKTFATRFGSHDTVKGARVELKRKYVDGRQVRGWAGVSVRKPGDDGGDPFSDVPPPEPQAAEEPRETFEAAGEQPQTPSGGLAGFDIETASADELFRGRHEGPFVRLVGGIDTAFRTDGGWTTGTNVEGLIDALNSAEVIYGHNILGFDLLALARHHGADYDALAAKAVDTQVISQLLDPPEARGQNRTPHGLDDVAKRLGHAGKSDDIKALAKEFGGFDRIPVEDPRYRDYLRGDLEATKYVYDKLRWLRTDDSESSPSNDRVRYAEREMRVMALVNRMTLNGWKIDVELLARRVQEEEERRKAAALALHTEFGMPLAPPDKIRVLPMRDWPEELYQRLRGTTTKRCRETVKRYARIWPDAAVERGLAVRIPQEPNASPWSTDRGRAALVKALADAGAPFYPQTAGGDLALSADALGEGDWFDKKAKRSRPGLLKVYGDKPGVRRIVELLNDATGATAKYAEIQTWTTPEGRVHAGTGAPQASGRWATTHPASANLGKRGEKVEQRRVFVADDGHVQITCDLSQVDVRTVAAHSQDPVLIDMLQPGRDYHSDMAELFSGDRGKRKEFKPVSHGLNYNQSYKTIAEQHGLPLDMVKQAAGAHAERLHVLQDWKARIIEEAERTGVLDNGFGRLMRCNPDRAYTQAPALMGQGAARDVMTESMLRFVDLGDKEGLPVRDYLRGVVHDELVLSVPEDQADAMAQMLKEAFTWEWKGVPILCDVSRPGRNWAECAD